MNKRRNMCDLIDLNSPDRKGLLSTRLASPLIPVPRDTASSNYNNRINEPSSVINGKRDSLENNPFDMVLHKTTEYIQKKDDPFEMILEEALRPQCKEKTTLRTSSLDFIDTNFMEKETTNTLNMNRTLDESLFSKKLNKKSVLIDKTSNHNVITDSNNTNVLSDDLKSDNVKLSLSKDDCKLPTIDIQDIDLSILNQSVMNDTLFEMEKESNKNETKYSLEDKTESCMEKDTIDIEQSLISTATLKIPKLRRSFSQGEAIIPKKSQYLNETSLIDPLRIGSIRGSSVSSTNSFDVLNDGFIKSHYGSGSSVLSSLSNISSITKVNSVSSVSNFSVALSNGTMNRTFLESCLSEKSDTTKLNENIDFNKETNSAFSLSKNSATAGGNALNATRFSLSDLTDRFNKLTTNPSDVPIHKNSTNEKNEEKLEECNKINKLIDVDVFTPELNCSKHRCKSFGSDGSSDSVFVEGDKINKSIFHEAKLLARTFEELALKTSSGSSMDDLLTSNPLWTSELLPAFDDEVIVDNLIELPTSPTASDINSKRKQISENVDKDSIRSEKLHSNEVVENVQNLEIELLEPVSTETRITAGTLLLDLKKLIKTENNTEANKLLDNLEKVLGVNYENNTELLATYLNITNNLAKSPKKSSSSLEIIKNVAENNMEYSQEDNLTTDSSEVIKESIFCTNMNLNNSNMSKCATNNEKCLKEINNESKIGTIEMSTSTDKINKEKNRDGNIQNTYKKNAHKTEDSNLLNEKIAVELLTSLAKLLSGQTEEHSTLYLLRNLGKVLHSASSTCNHADKETESDNIEVEIQQSSKKPKLKFENKTYSPLLSKSLSRLSLNMESKKQPSNKNLIRRSISVTQTSTIKGASSSLMSKEKSTSQLKEVTKRFPSDPGFISPTANKKVTTNIIKNDIVKDTRAKTVTTLDLQKEKATMVKNKLKKKIGADIVNKKGPLKAIIPIGSMQKRETFSKKLISPTGNITPPKTHKIISSTPNSAGNGSTVKKSSRSSKPIASSTPDAQNSKTRKLQSQISTCPKKRNFSCDISPVTTHVNVSHTNGTNNSPRRSYKLPSPKKITPKRSIDSNIPKSRTPPVHKRLNSSFDFHQYELPVSPQRSSSRLSYSQKGSPISVKKDRDNAQQSPLRDSNKLIHKVKPINLISKLRRHSFGANAMEKENNYI